MTRPLRCLFVMEDHPLTQDADGGGPVLMYSHLELFAHSGASVTLLLVRRDRRSLGFERYTQTDGKTWERVRGWIESHHVFRMPIAAPRRSAPLTHLLLGMRDPAAYVYPDVTTAVLAEFERLVAEADPDLIWAENLIPSLLAVRAKTQLPVVFSHHDHISKLGRLAKINRGSGWRPRFHSWTAERLERAVIRAASACVSGSAVEAEELRHLNGGPVVYLPTTYPAPLDAPPGEIPETPRVIHLGGMKTIANRGGLARFLEIVWPRLKQDTGAFPEFWVVGDLEGAPESFRARLASSGAVMTGFVRNLSEVLRPGDIHIVPWEYATGTRTRIPVILRHGQVLLSTRAAASCLPELRDGEDCVLVDDLAEMAEQVRLLAGDRERRARLSRAARQSFERHFVRQAVQPRFDAFLEETAPVGSARRSTRDDGSPGQAVFSRPARRRRI